jgi:preprotein translocase subunit SecF
MNLSNKFKNYVKNFDTVKSSKKVLMASAGIIITGLLVMIIFGFNLGIDFTGGTVIKVELGSEIENQSVYEDYKNQLEGILEDNGLELSLAQKEGTAQNASILVRFQDISGYNESQMADVINAVRSDITTQLGLDEDAVQNSQRIGPSATAALLQNALLAILFATILILIYIAIRFELLSGISAIAALLHDVLIMLSLVAIFQLQINSAFVAALITIIGYSINDTIVVFDRVRENRAKQSYKEKSNSSIVNISIRETIVRTINTSATTLFAITMLAVISVPTIREFAIPIIFGILSGVLSSIFVATPIWAIVNDKTRPKNPKPGTQKTQDSKQKQEILQV